MRLLTILAVIAALGVLVVPAAQADLLLLDYFGFDYTTPAPRDFTSPGQEYVAIGDVTDINPDALVTDPLNNEYTFVMRAGTLTSADTVWTPLGDVATYQFNSGDGTFHIYEDPIATGSSRDWGTYPPNATAPAYFEDGTLILGATFTNLTITVRLADWTANLNGTLTFYCGEGWGSLPCYEGWTFAGQTIEPGQPDGYMWTIDGLVYVEQISTEKTSWGELKDLFR